MKTLSVAICVAVCFGRNVSGQEQKSVKVGIETAGLAGLGVYQTALAHPDI
jgi:hypothetical protein